MLSGLANPLAGAQVVRLDLGHCQAHGSSSWVVPKVKDVLQRYVIAVQGARQKVGDLATVPCGVTQELHGDGRLVER